MSEHECIVCGNMHDPERAEQAERALAEKDRWQEKVCTKCGYIAVVHDTKEAFDTLRATLARVEGERDSLIRQLGIADREVKRRGEERDGLLREVGRLSEEVDRLRGDLQLDEGPSEADGLRAALEGLLAEWRGLKLNEVPATLAADAALGRSASEEQK